MGPEHFQYHCPMGRQSRGGRGGCVGRGGGRGRADSAVAATHVSQQELQETIERVSMQLAASKASSSHAMSAHARGMYLKLYALIMDSGCSNQMTPNRSMFTSHIELRIPSCAAL